MLGENSTTTGKKYSYTFYKEKHGAGTWFISTRIFHSFREYTSSSSGQAITIVVYPNTNMGESIGFYPGM